MALTLVPIDSAATRRFPRRLVSALIIGLVAAGAWWLVVEVRNVRTTASRMADT